jgi:hypothetical protein
LKVPPVVVKERSLEGVIGVPFGRQRLLTIECDAPWSINVLSGIRSSLPLTVLADVNVVGTRVKENWLLDVGSSIIITETLIVKMLLYGHSIAGEKVGCKGQELWSGESTTSLNHVRHLQRNRSCSNPPK